jgi:hypothetical protein
MIDLKPPFEEVYQELEPKIRGRSYNYHAGSLSQEDTYGEMLLELWKTWEKWEPRPDVPFEVFYFMCWHNKAGAIANMEKAKKRPQDVVHISFDLPDGHEVVGYIPPWPKYFTERDRKIWVLLALGFTTHEIADLVGFANGSGVSRTTKRWRSLFNHAIEGALRG